MTFTWNPKDFFIANRYNLLIYLSRSLAGMAYLMAAISLYTTYVFPELSDATEERARELMESSKAVYRHAVAITMPNTWEKLMKEREEAE